MSPETRSSAVVAPATLAKRDSVIRKRAGDLRPVPHLFNYEAERRQFSWQAPRWVKCPGAG
jgi:hypothetical protein